MVTIMERIKLWFMVAGSMLKMRVRFQIRVGLLIGWLAVVYFNSATCVRNGACDTEM